jgi:hypothetical protein
VVVVVEPPVLLEPEELPLDDPEDELPELEEPDEDPPDELPPDDDPPELEGPQCFLHGWPPFEPPELELEPEELELDEEEDDEEEDELDEDEPPEVLDVVVEVMPPVVVVEVIPPVEVEVEPPLVEVELPPLLVEVLDPVEELSLSMSISMPPVPEVVVDTTTLPPLLLPPPKKPPKKPPPKPPPHPPEPPIMLTWPPVAMIGCCGSCGRGTGIIASISSSQHSSTILRSRLTVLGTRRGSTFTYLTGCSPFTTCSDL